MSIYDAADLDLFARPHVQRAWFSKVYLPDGTRYYHTGMGRAVMDGQTWEGVSDPVGGAMVAINGMEEPAFGQAIAVDVLFSGASKAFLKSIWDNRDDIEGAQCDLFFAVFDAETGFVLKQLTMMIPGKLTAPGIRFIGASIRAIAMKVVSIYEGINFAATGAMWSPAGQRQRYPGDKGLDAIGSDIIEEYIP